MLLGQYKVIDVETVLYLYILNTFFLVYLYTLETTSGFLDNFSFLYKATIAINNRKFLKRISEILPGKQVKLNIIMNSLWNHP